ncbi:DUF192 domain-containing protein [Undibacterium sp. SXout20W]|uniref:DUF192 domain-containing protein n=1 Tax=Undibacterium sp. SXout20W TaxID=3413051 RepID=UPI003BEF54D0
MTKITSITMQLLAAASLALISSTSQAQLQGKMPVKQLSVGIYVIQAEVASTPAEREQGLMLRTKMGGNEGMVFDFGAPAGVCMWMKNTLIPLSVAFIDIDGRIVNIEDMQPETLDSHCAKRTVNYALEMNLGWFKQKNIKPGMKIEGLPLK